MQIIKKISLEVCKSNLFKLIVAKQHDSNSRYLKVTFVDDSKKIDIPSTAEVVISATRSDGETKCFAGEANHDGTATVPLTSWMLELSGTLTVDVSVIASEGSRLTASTFIVEVESTSYDNGDISEDENYDILVKLIEEVKGLQESDENGKDGFSPIVEVAETENGHSVKITDAEGEHTFEVANGKDGADGKTPVKGVDYFTKTDKQEIANEVAQTIPLPKAVFVVTATVDFANMCLANVSHSLEEIKSAHERNEHIVLNADIGQMIPTGITSIPLSMIDGSSAVFSLVVYMGNVTNFLVSIESERTYLLVNELVTQGQLRAINNELDDINGEVV